MAVTNSGTVQQGKPGAGGTSVRGPPHPSDGRVRCVHFIQRNSEMLSQLAHHTTTILRRSRLFAPWPPSALGAFHFSPIFRGHSWSSQSQPANWSHLNDVYSKVVDVKPKETLLSPEERWAVQSRARMANLTPPKGPYAGRVLHSVEPHDFLIYH
jgi:hypothetical protein